MLRPINLKLQERDLQYVSRSIFQCLGFHRGVDELSGLQRCVTASLGDWFPVF
jgi:hypothetical protein